MTARRLNNLWAFDSLEHQDGDPRTRHNCVVRGSHKLGFEYGHVVVAVCQRKRRDLRETRFLITALGSIMKTPTRYPYSRPTAARSSLMILVKDLC